MKHTTTNQGPTTLVAEEGSVAGRVALVTGGTRGIGAAISRSLARHGAIVAAGYSSNRERAEAFQPRSIPMGPRDHPPEKRRYPRGLPTSGAGGHGAPRPPRHPRQQRWPHRRSADVGHDGGRLARGRGDATAARSSVAAGVVRGAFGTARQSHPDHEYPSIGSDWHGSVGRSVGDPMGRSVALAMGSTSLFRARKLCPRPGDMPQSACSGEGSVTER
jgi:hypothetical protein